tara:strand:- start:185 stop:454 length:270 start_codon:yes stop_codon:yes gene_type:complete
MTQMGTPEHLKEIEELKRKLKKEITNKIKSVNSVYIFDCFTEYYLKTNKQQLLYVFNQSVKMNTYDPIGFLNDFKDKLLINENNELFYN